MMREFLHVFGDTYLEMSPAAGGSSGLDIIAIPTNQRARVDLVAVGDHVEAEKDRLLNVVRTGTTIIST